MWGQTRSFSVHPQTAGNFQTAGSRGSLAFFLFWRSFSQSQHEGAWAPQSDDVLWTGPLFFPCTVHYLSEETAEQPQVLNKNAFSKFQCTLGQEAVSASLAQLVEHALPKRMVVGSIHTGGSLM